MILVRVMINCDSNVIRNKIEEGKITTMCVRDI